MLSVAVSPASEMVDTIVTTWLDSPLGPLLAGAKPEGICLLEFNDRKALDYQLSTLQQRMDASIVEGEHEHLDRLAEELKLYFAGQLREFTVPLVYPGTAFQQRVWDQLLKISYGATLSYEELAQKVGVPNAQRAVGLANGKNRIAIVIPCHRVINKSGRLGGYGGGLWRKEFLLELECGKAPIRS